MTKADASVLRVYPDPAVTVRVFPSAAAQTKMPVPLNPVDEQVPLPPLVV
jgi:hypothetical protein